MKKTICELFAGVGGFRLGFDRLGSGWETVWFSQWEPGARTQWAHGCYVHHFGDLPDLDGAYHTGEDISTVDKSRLPDQTLLVGGFPCQDYSVAHTLASSKGIEGKKGVLWWQIRDILETKQPPFCLLENVDRLLRSPASSAGATSASSSHASRRSDTVWSGASSMRRYMARRSGGGGRSSSPTTMTARPMADRWPTSPPRPSSRRTA